MSLRRRILVASSPCIRSEPMNPMLIHPDQCPVRCSATVDLISRVRRPFLFEVNVWGEPPHAHRRKYNITAESDNSAAMKGLELFTKEFNVAMRDPELVSHAPLAKLD